ncbi:formate dehydrogenase accessory sulfurtransferase FdhD [Alphaproteobacteria bacterium]|nr:formate dehydrogenase accessory sulfurtransferase FdhD [Alphaproteobacteria bacterium]
MSDFIIKPSVNNNKLFKIKKTLDENGNLINLPIIVEKPLTLYLNNQEIVTMMTINDYPEYLAIGYLYNQGMLENFLDIKKVEYHRDLKTIVVRTNSKTNYEAKLKKKINTSGCAQGTVFGDLISEIEGIKLNKKIKITPTQMMNLSKIINMEPSLYLKVGAIHGCVLCDVYKPMYYFEDVGRHNAVDKIAGLIIKNDINTSDKIFYTTGRLTSEMVIKCIKMQIPILISRSGFTAWAVEIAKKKKLTMIGRVRGKRFNILSGEFRLQYE